MPQFLLELGPVRREMMDEPTEEEMHLVGRHYSYWQRLTEEGVALVVGRTQDENPNGYAVFVAGDEELAKAVIQADPAVGKVFTYAVRPYKVALLGHTTKFQP